MINTQIFHLFFMAKFTKEFAMKLAEIVGKNIALRRMALGMSQKELAYKLNITQDALNRMEKGKIAPKMGRLEDIAKCLQCPVTFLFRSASNSFSDRCATIADILATLPSEAQEIMVNLVAETARVMNFYKK